MAKQKKSTKKFLKNNNLKQLVQARKQRNIKKNNAPSSLMGSKKTSNDAVKTKKSPKMMMDEDEDGDTMLHDDGVELDFDSDEDNDNMNGLENDSNDEDASGDDEEEAEEEGDDDNLENFDAEEFSEEEEEEKDDGNSMVDDDDVDVDGHKSQLEQLKQKDPEFYKFLQQNDANLLNFGESEDEDDEEDEEVEDDDDQEDEDQEKIKAASDKEQIILSLKLVNSWKSSLNTSKSIRALKKLLVAFRAAVAYSQANDDGDRVDEFAYSIPNSSVHKAVMLATIKYAPIVLSHHLTPTKGSTLPSSSPKWNRLSPLTKSFLSNFLKSLSQMTDPTMLQYALHQSTLGGSHGIVPMMACFPKYAKEYVTVLARLWSSKIGVADDDDESDDEEKEDNDKEDEEDDDQSSSEDEDEDQDSETEDAEQVAQRLEKQAKQKKKRAAKKAKARANKKSSAKAASASSSATSIKNGYESVRVVAFLGMRKLAVVAPSYVDLILKKSYKAYMATVAKTSALTISSNQLLTSTLIELFLLSPTQQLYTHLFVQIRSLAHLLKSAMSTSTSGGGGGQSQQQQQQQQSAASTTNTHLKKIYSWWFIWSIEFLSGVLGKGCSQTGSSVSDKKGQLGSLIYPLVQIVLGVMRLKTSSKYFPHKFHLIKSLTAVAQKTNTYIPLPSYLFSIFDSAEIASSSGGKPSTLKKFDFAVNVKVANGYLGTRVFQTGVVEETVDLLFDWYSTMATDIAFPEMCLPAILQLKRFIKSSKSAVLSKSLQQLIEKLQQNSKFIEIRRGRVEFSPKDTNQALAFSASITANESPLLKYQKAKQRVKKLAST